MGSEASRPVCLSVCLSVCVCIRLFPLWLLQRPLRPANNDTHGFLFDFDSWIFEKTKSYGVKKPIEVMRMTSLVTFTSAPAILGGKKNCSALLVWYPDPSVQAHARTRITVCACGKEGSGEMVYPSAGPECETAHKMSCYEYA